jgi:hypothetical protein
MEIQKEWRILMFAARIRMKSIMILMYFFSSYVYALDSCYEFSLGTDRFKVLRKVEGVTITKGSIVNTFPCYRIEQRFVCRGDDDSANFELSGQSITIKYMHLGELDSTKNYSFKKSLINSYTLTPVKCW